MLSQRTSGLWEGNHVGMSRAGPGLSSRRASGAAWMQRRRASATRGRAVAVVVTSEGGDGGGLRVAARGAGEGAGAGIVGRLSRVALRPPAPLPEGGRVDGDAEECSREESAAGSEPVLQATTERDETSFERFARARAAGRELVERTKQSAGLGFVDDAGVCYEPQVGDCVIGVVASGSCSSLDVDIGARALGHLFLKDVMPLDNCGVREMSWDGNASALDPPPHGLHFIRDDDVLDMAVDAPVEPGTVLTLEVKGTTPSGRALLSARSVARDYAWHRVRQLLEYNAIFEVEITEWTTAGLVSRVEGLRAFLPIYYLVNRAPEPATTGSVSYKEYVGRKFSVMIRSVDEARRNLVISEKKAWMTKNAYIGALVEGIVSEIQPYGVLIRMKNTDMSGLLHISNISRARVNNIASVFSIGEEVKVMVVPASKTNRLSFSTVELETEHGLILRDKEAVFRDAKRIADEIAKAYECKQSASAPDRTDAANAVGQKRVIANWDWLDFGDRTDVE